jgi:poly(A) polymerase
MATPATQQTALFVLRRLRRAGYCAYFAGGCVRDRLMRKRTYDYDVATDATPKQVRKLFGHVLLIGAQFGVAVVVHQKQTVEVATFRTDATYTDGRRPDAVCFSSPQEDALRRDFTINGMFYDPISREVIDYVDGQRDIKRRIVRTIGSPDQRFAEDYLRMIRAVRFAVRLDFTLEPATRDAITKHASKVVGVSGERICDELTKMLAHTRAADALTMLATTGLAKHILPTRAATGWDTAVARAEALANHKDSTLMMMSLLGDLPAKAGNARLRHWGAANTQRDAVAFARTHWNAWGTLADAPLCDFKRMMAGEHFHQLRKIWRLLELAQTGRVRESTCIARRAGTISPEQVAPAPFVTGGDLLEMGVKQGPALGKILNTLYDAQLNEELRSRRAALTMAKKLIAQ